MKYFLGFSGRKVWLMEPPEKREKKHVVKGSCINKRTKEVAKKSKRINVTRKPGNV